MALIAIFFLVSALFILARVPRGYQAVWLGSILFTFGCCTLGLIGFIARFGNYLLEGSIIPLEQPSWAWRLLAYMPLETFIRFRLWSVALFLVSVVGFAFSYSTESWKPSDLWTSGAILALITGMLWLYDPGNLFLFFKTGAGLLNDPLARERWKSLMKLADQISLALNILILLFALMKIFNVWLRSTIVQKRAQALGVGVGAGVLCVFFIVLFVLGPVSVLNAHSMATTLLPVSNYPIFDTTYLQALPFAGLVAFGAVMLSIFRYGFLGTWRIGTQDLDRQINMANQAVRFALHSFKNRFLAIKMAMNMAAAELDNFENTMVESARTQVQWARDVCTEALDQLNVLHIHSNRLQVKTERLSMVELWEEAKHRCASRLTGAVITEDCLFEGIYVWGDREYLVAVLENLLQNSVDAMTGWSITPRMQVKIGREYEWGYIRITDNGPGISRENIRKIFRPFFTTKTTRNNWGLGLAFCHRVIKAHRGFLNLWTAPSNGATVEVVMRCRENIDASTDCPLRIRRWLRKFPPGHRRGFGG